MAFEIPLEVEEKVMSGRAAEKRYALLGFGGWPDAGRVASLTVEYFARALKAEKLMELDCSEIHDLTMNRPFVEIREALIESFRMPGAVIYFWKDPGQSSSLIIFSGVEPSLRWREFSDFIIGLCKTISARRIYLVGGVLDQVPHTRRPRISAVVNMEHLKSEMLLSGLDLTEYSGPASIHSYLMIKAKQMGLEAVGLWAHTPAYVQHPNAIAAYHLAVKLAELMKITIDLSELKMMADSLRQAISRAMEENADLRRMVEEIERMYDERYGKPSYIA
ncbi:MAG: PAC2 family protein [Nitrososphaerota archaeon]